MTSPLLPSHRAIGSRSTGRNEVFSERGGWWWGTSMLAELGKLGTGLVAPSWEILASFWCFPCFKG